jgi:hypothetical protein
MRALWIPACAGMTDCAAGGSLLLADQAERCRAPRISD